MATGPLTSAKVEVEFVAGVWTDVSAYVAGEQEMGGQRLRASEFEDVSPGTWRVVFRNDDGRFTPDNAASPYYPNVVEAKRIRVSITKGATTYPRFFGFISAWEPSFPNVDSYQGVVTVSAADALSVMASTSMYSQWAHQGTYLGMTSGTFADTFLTNGTMNGSSVQNVGYDGGAGLGTAMLVSPMNNAGAYSYTTDDTVLADGVLSLQPVNGVGPVLLMKPQPNAKNLDFLLQVPAGTAPGSGQTLCVLDSWVGGTRSVSLRLTYQAAGVADLSVISSTGTNLGTLVPSVNDGKWRRVTLQTYAGDNTKIGFYIDGGSTVTLPTGGTYVVSGVSFGFSSGYQFLQAVTGVAADLRTLTRVYLGGIAGNAEGKQTICPAINVATPVFLGTIGSISSGYYQPKQTLTVANLWTDIINWFPVLMTGYTVYGSDARFIVRVNSAGRPLLDVVKEAARTHGGAVWVDLSGLVIMAYPDAMRDPVILNSIDFEDDIDAESQPPTFKRSVDSKPTRATATSPFGTGVSIDTAAEANGARRDVSLDTVAPSASVAKLAADLRLNASNKLRVSQISVDLATAKNDLWVTFGLDMVLGTRLRITNLPTSVFGVSYMDVYVEGWTEAHTITGSRFTLDLSPADSPVEGMFDDTEYGRFSAAGTMTVTGGTAIGTKSNGTLIITTAGGNPTLTTSAGDFPMDLDWNGERVTITSAPASAVSPQTVTITARGVAPTIARVHAANETVDVYHAAAFAI